MKGRPIRLLPFIVYSSLLGSSRGVGAAKAPATVAAAGLFEVEASLPLQPVTWPDSAGHGSQHRAHLIRTSDLLRSLNAKESSSIEKAPGKVFAIVGWSPRITNQSDAAGGKLGVIHHLNVRGCPFVRPEAEAAAEAIQTRTNVPPGGTFNARPSSLTTRTTTGRDTGDVASIAQMCPTMLASYDRGAEGFQMPADVGVMIPKSMKYLALQAHYLMPGDADTRHRACSGGNSSIGSSHPCTFEDASGLVLTIDASPSLLARRRPARLVGFMDVKLSISAQSPRSCYAYRPPFGAIQSRLIAGNGTRAGNGAGELPSRSFEIVAMHLHAHGLANEMTAQLLEESRDASSRHQSFMRTNVLGVGQLPAMLAPNSNLRVECCFNTSGLPDPPRFGLGNGEEMCGVLMVIAEESFTALSNPISSLFPPSRALPPRNTFEVSHVFPKFGIEQR